MCERINGSTAVVTNYLYIQLLMVGHPVDKWYRYQKNHKNNPLTQFLRVHSGCVKLGTELDIFYERMESLLYPQSLHTL